MKKLYVSALIVTMAVFFSYCHSAKKASAATATKSTVSYEVNVQPIIVGNCAPCHFPAKGGNKEALDTYTNVSKEVDGIIRRIQLNPDEKGFMPMRHPKLSDADIATIKAWKDGGLTEK